MINVSLLSPCVRDDKKKKGEDTRKDTKKNIKKDRAVIDKIITPATNERKTMRSIERGKDEKK